MGYLKLCYLEERCFVLVPNSSMLVRGVFD